MRHDAGRYLCNYLCWRAAEAASTCGLRLVSFIHVPRLQRIHGRSRQPQLTFDDLALAGEAILRAALAAR